MIAKTEQPKEQPFEPFIFSSREGGNSDIRMSDFSQIHSHFAKTVAYCKLLM